MPFFRVYICIHVQAVMCVCECVCALVRAFVSVIVRVLGRSWFLAQSCRPSGDCCECESA